MKKLLGSIQFLLRAFGYQIVSLRRISEALETQRLATLTSLACSLGNRQSQDRLLSLASESSSQLGQDLFALAVSDLKRGGYFVEFGAGDGVHLSNTLLLERDFGWTGVLAEPLSRYHDSILKNRAARLETRCVWSESNQELDFFDNGYLSTISAFLTSDTHSRSKSRSKHHRVPTISLEDLLRSHNAPHEIDFLSIDTEGSELRILEAFRWNYEYQINAIACEHNFGPNRVAIESLLVSVGYRRVARHLSAHDDWFILDSLDVAHGWLGNLETLISH
jgi:FkbM family methyltransferase